MRSQVNMRRSMMLPHAARRASSPTFSPAVAPSSKPTNRSSSRTRGSSCRRVTLLTTSALPFLTLYVSADFITVTYFRRFFPLTLNFACGA